LKIGLKSKCEKWQNTQIPKSLEKSSRDFISGKQRTFIVFDVEIVFLALVNYVRFFPVWGKVLQIPGAYLQLCSLS
jgi:hypothetical protein